MTEGRRVHALTGAVVTKQVQTPPAPLAVMLADARAPAVLALAPAAVMRADTGAKPRNVCHRAAPRTPPLWTLRETYTERHTLRDIHRERLY